MNTLKYTELKDWYLNDQTAKDNAKKYFGDKQPNIFATGFYSAPSWNWGYHIGITGVEVDNQTRWFEVVTQFGTVKAAREISLPVY